MKNGKSRTRNQVPGKLANIETIVFSRAEIHAWLLQGLLHRRKIRVGVIRVACDYNGLAGHPGHAYEEDIVVGRGVCRGHLWKGFKNKLSSTGLPPNKTIHPPHTFYCNTMNKLSSRKRDSSGSMLWTLGCNCFLPNCWRTRSSALCQVLRCCRPPTMICVSGLATKVKCMQ